MKTLIKCPACQRDISPNATSCPHCGEPSKAAPKQTATGFLAALLIGLIVGGLIYFFLVGL